MKKIVCILLCLLCIANFSAAYAINQVPKEITLDKNFSKYLKSPPQVEKITAPNQTISAEKKPVDCQKSKEDKFCSSVIISKKDPIILKSYLKEYYNAYLYEIKNNNPNTIDINYIRTDAYAYQTISDKEFNMGMCQFFGGLFYPVIIIFDVIHVPYQIVTLPLNPTVKAKSIYEDIRVLFIVPKSMTIDPIRNKLARKELKHFAYKYPLIVKPNESIQINVIIKNKQPELLIFDSESKKEYTITEPLNNLPEE